MKRILLLFFLLNMWGNLPAQDKFTRYEKNLKYEADIYFFQEDYYYAYELYESIYKAHPQSAEINYRLGTCLFHIYGRQEESREYLQKAVEGEITEAFFYRALLAHLDEDFDVAFDLLQEYLSMGDRLQPAKTVERYIHMVNSAKSLMSKPLMVEITNCGPSINSADSDYAPLIDPITNRIYFTSRRPNPDFPERDITDRPYEDIYYADWQDGQWTPAQPLGAPVNSSFHDATVSISSDGKALLLYRSNRMETGGDLYLSEIENSKWSTPQKLNDRINSNHMEASASFSGDGGILYFSSDRPGGYGGKDIYRVKKLPTGKWSQPQNLGPVINTSSDEDSPYVGADGKLLYFSSKGHENMGGYDIFVSREEDDGFWSFPENLGYPINTVHDDVHFTMGEDGRAFFSSARKQGEGGHDLYEIAFSTPHKKAIIIEGRVKSANNDRIGKSKITVYEENGEVQGIYSGQPFSGNFILALKPNQTYEIVVEAEGYSPKRTTHTFNADSANLKQDYKLEILLSRY